MDQGNVNNSLQKPLVFSEESGASDIQQNSSPSAGSPTGKAGDSYTGLSHGSSSIFLDQTFAASSNDMSSYQCGNLDGQIQLEEQALNFSATGSVPIDEVLPQQMSQQQLQPMCFTSISLPNYSNHIQMQMPSLQNNQAINSISSGLPADTILLQDVPRDQLVQHGYHNCQPIAEHISPNIASIDLKSQGNVNVVNNNNNIDQSLVIEYLLQLLAQGQQPAQAPASMQMVNPSLGLASNYIGSNQYNQSNVNRGLNNQNVDTTLQLLTGQQQQQQQQWSNSVQKSSAKCVGKAQQDPTVQEVEAKIIMARVRNCTSMVILEAILRENFAVMDSDHLCLVTWRMAQLVKKAPASCKPKVKVHARKLVRSFIMPTFIHSAQSLTPRQLSTMYWALSRLGAAKQYYQGITVVVGQEILKRIDTFNPVDYSMMIQSWSSMRNPIPEVGECLLINAPRFIPDLDQQSLSHIAFAIGIMLPDDVRATQVLDMVVAQLERQPDNLSLDAISLFLMGAARVGYVHVAFLQTALRTYTPTSTTTADFNQIEHLLYYCACITIAPPPQVWLACRKRLLQLLPRLRIEELHRLVYVLSQLLGQNNLPSGVSNPENFEFVQLAAAQARGVLYTGQWSEQRCLQISACLDRLDTLIGGGVGAFGRGLIGEQLGSLAGLLGRGVELVDPVDMGLEKSNGDVDFM